MGNRNRKRKHGDSGSLSSLLASLPMETGDQADEVHVEPESEPEHHHNGRNYNPVLNSTASRKQVVSAFSDFWAEYEKAVEHLIRAESAEWSQWRPSTYFEVSDDFVVNILPEVKEVLFFMFMGELREQSVQAKNRGFWETAKVADKQLELSRLKWIALAPDYAAVDVNRFVVEPMRAV